jgi:hypothetical protein
MKNIVLSAIALAVLCACATRGSLSDDQRLDIYRAHAGAPVNSFLSLGGLHSWTSLGDSALAVWVRPGRGYLLTLVGSCPDLEYARALRFSGQSGTVFARLDNVMVLDRNSLNVPCRINQIQPLDANAIRQAERDARNNQASLGGT